MTALVGGALGGMLALGLILVAVGQPFGRQVDLCHRIEPYLDHGAFRLRSPFSPEQPWTPSLALQPILSAAGSRLDRVLGGTDSVRTRLQRAGLPEDVEGFRIQQVLWGAVAGAGAVTVASLLWWVRGASLPALAVVVCSATVGGVFARDQALTRAATRRERRLLAEFPAVAELLALAVTAGESTGQALERVARLSSGELAAELDLALAQARTGTPLTQALRDLGARTGLPAVVRFVEGLVVAIERGTPLGEVLRAQAHDAREAARQALIEEGGKREIAMMVPVVFLVLPVTVMFAVYPGVSMLRISV